MMQTSDAGRAAIMEREGCKLTAYLDGGGVPTIGVGHTKGVKLGDTCTVKQAMLWLTEDAREAEQAVNQLVKVPLNQNQFDALVSFTFNLGAGALERSTLLKYLNAGNYSAASGQFKLWDMVAGKPCEGVLRRRLSEAEQFNQPVAGAA